MKLPKLFTRFRKGLTILEKTEEDKTIPSVCRKGMIKTIAFLEKYLYIDKLDEYEIKLHQFLFNNIKKLMKQSSNYFKIFRF